MRIHFIVLLACGAGALGAQQSNIPADSAARRLHAVRVTARRAQGGYAAASTTTATRTNLPLRDTPRAVSIVTRQLIADQSMQSMADVVRYTPGVSMASGEGHRDAPTIRGNNTTADFFVDGMRDDAQYLRDLYNAERVEVLKGPEALLFGRGGGGGIINRVTRQAGWTPVASLTTEGGSFDHKRGVADFGDALTPWLAGRATGMYEQSGGFRDAATLTRYGLNPTAAMMAGSHTMLRAGYELFDDARRVDRGVPSFHGRPTDGDITTFFGNPDVNHADTRVNLATASIEHEACAGVTFRNRTTFGDYDKFYQNTYPGAVNSAGSQVALSAYNHGIKRRNLLNVSDATVVFSTGRIRHSLLTGVDVSRQRTAQVRRTGYFNDSTASVLVPLASPTIAMPVAFRQSATDADNVAVAHDASAYVQDQLAFSPKWLLLAGVRYERFGLAYHNNRTGQNLERVDRLVSPRAGVVFKPIAPLSLYTSYGVSHLPSSGDQFTSLSVTTSALEPERFTNREAGAKWDARDDLSFSGAVYRLDRTNTSAPDPNNPAVTVQTGAQRTVGWEFGATGAPTTHWGVVAGVGSQRATIVTTTNAAKAGATVALVPHTTLSLWNRYQVARAVGLGLGLVHQTRMYAAVDNTVTLPAFTRADAAMYVALHPGVQVQVNVENLFDTRYFATTQGNNNIMPGAPRTLRVGATLTRQRP